MSDTGLDVRERELVLDAVAPVVVTGVGAGDYSKKSCLHRDIDGLFDAPEEKCSNSVLSDTKDDC